MIKLKYNQTLHPETFVSPKHGCLKSDRREEGIILGHSSTSKNKLEKKVVRFDTVEIRQYERQPGDNPSVSSGVPLSLGWNYWGTHSRSLEEGDITGRRTRQELALDSKERERILRHEWGYSFQQIHEASEASMLAKQRRTETLLLDSNRRLRTMDKFREHSLRMLDRMLSPNRQETPEARTKCFESTPTRMRRRSNSVPNLEATKLRQPLRRTRRSSSLSKPRNTNDDLSAGALAGWARKHDFQEMQSCLTNLVQQRQSDHNNNDTNSDHITTTISDSRTDTWNDSKATIIRTTIQSQQRPCPKNYNTVDDKVHCELKSEERTSSIKPSLSRSLSFPSLLLHTMPLSKKKHFSIGNTFHKKPPVLLSNSAYVESWSRKHDIRTTLQLCISIAQEQQYVDHNSNTRSSPTTNPRECIPFGELQLGITRDEVGSRSCIPKRSRNHRYNSSPEIPITNSWSTSASLEVWRRKHDLEANKLCLPN